MLDIKYIRENREEFIGAMKTRNWNITNVDIDRFMQDDQERRELIQKLESLKAKKNKLSKSKPTPDQIIESKDINKDIEKEEILLKSKEKLINNFLGRLPNIPQPEVPIGKDDSKNKVIKTVNKETKFDFKSKDYLELAKIHDLIDMERAAKVSGSRFSYLKNEGALLWFALVRYAQDILLKEKFIPFISPVLVKKEMMENSGYDSYLDGQEAYCIEKDSLYLVGTGEHALLPYHSDEILNQADLPKYYSTYSTCFRREAGSYGKDTKGILRVHQFDKLEMVILTTPDKSKEEFEHLVKIQEKIIQGLNLPYQLLEVCTGDLPKPSSRVIDLECWIPSEKKYRETHSASNCTDYQARRNNIRFKDKDGKAKFVHILNATAITPRALIAVLENYQQKDGSVKIPKILRKYLDFKTIKK